MFFLGIIEPILILCFRLQYLQLFTTMARSPEYSAAYRLEGLYCNAYRLAEISKSYSNAIGKDTREHGKLMNSEIWHKLFDFETGAEFYNFIDQSKK